MIDRFTHWLASHPEMLIHTWPLLTAAILWFVRARTPEEMQHLPAWQQRTILFVQASGLDVRGVLNALKPKGAASIPPPPKSERGCAGRRPIFALAGVAGIVAIALSVQSCALFTPKNIKTVLDASQIACAIANSTMSNEDVSRICAISNDMRPALDSLLSSHRAGVAKAQRETAAACYPGPKLFNDMGVDMGDGGTDAAP